MQAARTTTIYLDPPTLAALDRVRVGERRSRSNLIGVLVAEGLARRAGEPPEPEDVPRPA